ncbi:NAD(P)-binding protein [Heliocybe sulcata]|uniref:NAD(P)-binding protein n=1 Tax=Heliocybe sulcata TaxID=5364 RepID=A0A5C3MWI5_9AGAM|nr:NAD(P)-binding protein [Heliocybe sulcata]
MLWRLVSNLNGIDQFRATDEPWALVTGASDGIGKSLCKVLAKRGFNVLLHGRDHRKLYKCCQELLAAHPSGKFELIVADATQPATVQDVVTAVRGRPITVLINNAGYTTGPVQPLLTIDPEEIGRAISIGITWTIQLTRALLPRLVETQPSVIVNVGSYAASHPPPFISVYTGTKGFLQAFSQSLRNEMRTIGHKGVEVQYHEVYFCSTKSNGAPENLATPSPNRMAHAIIAAVGSCKGHVVPYWVHELLSWLFLLVPERIISRIAGSVLARKRTDTGTLWQ